ncbi:hypothetical protein C8R44DRAFT_806153 [Mycena epipterygia]|nr:hypothetical protein C8R44DRAFT_806153 [Mycena epipterygia]
MADDPLDRKAFNALIAQNKSRLLTVHEQELLREFLDEATFDHLGFSEAEVDELIERMSAQNLSAHERGCLKDAGKDAEDWLNEQVAEFVHLIRKTSKGNALSGWELKIIQWFRESHLDDLDSNPKKGLPSLKEVDKLIAKLKAGNGLKKGNRQKLIAAAAEDDDAETDTTTTTTTTIVGSDDYGSIYAVEHVPDEQALGGPLSRDEWYFHMARAKCWEYENERSSRQPSPPITAFASEVALRKMIHDIGGDMSAIPEVLTKLAAFSDEVGGGFRICPTPFMWANDSERRRLSNETAKGFSTVSNFAKHRPNGPAALGVAICWIKSPVGQAFDDFYKAHFHVNLVLLIPSPIRNRPRTIVVCDPNIHSRMAQRTRTREVLFPRICNLLEAGEVQNLPRWCNKPREARNTKGICLRLALDWAVELVANGVAALGIQRDDGGAITQIKGFRELKK